MAETTISRNWLAKMALFIAAFLGLAVWGLVDAVAIYPARGAQHARYMEYKYLEALSETGAILRASVDDPRAALEDLEGRQRELADEMAALPPESVARQRVEVELARLSWLRSLANGWMLDAGRTTFDDPAARLEELEEEWASAEQPKGLSAFDIPMQWVFVVIGVGGAAWLGMTVLRVTRTKFTYEESTRTLTLPSGESFAPGDIAEVDKRKWHKYFVTIKLSEGATHTLDLLRYQPLEEWVLEMEKHSPGYEPPKDEAAGAGGGEGSGGAPVADGGGSEGEPDEKTAPGG